MKDVIQDSFSIKNPPQTTWEKMYAQTTYFPVMLIGTGNKLLTGQKKSEV